MVLSQNLPVKHVWKYLSESDKRQIPLSEVENSLKVLQWYIGQQSYFTGYVKEQKLASFKQKLVNFLKHHGGRCPRSKITQNAHIDARTLDDLLKIYPSSFKQQLHNLPNGHSYREIQLLSYLTQSKEDHGGTRDLLRFASDKRF